MPDALSKAGLSPTQLKSTNSSPGKTGLLFPAVPPSVYDTYRNSIPRAAQIPKTAQAPLGAAVNAADATKAPSGIPAENQVAAENLKNYVRLVHNQLSSLLSVEIERVNGEKKADAANPLYVGKEIEIRKGLDRVCQQVLSWPFAYLIILEAKSGEAAPLTVADLLSRTAKLKGVMVQLEAMPFTQRSSEFFRNDVTQVRRVSDQYWKFLKAAPNLDTVRANVEEELKTPGLSNHQRLVFNDIRNLHAQVLLQNSDLSAFKTFYEKFYRKLDIPEAENVIKSTASDLVLYEAFISDLSNGRIRETAPEGIAGDRDKHNSRWEALRKLAGVLHTKKAPGQEVKAEIEECWKEAFIPHDYDIPQRVSTFVNLLGRPMNITATNQNFILPGQKK